MKVPFVFLYYGYWPENATQEVKDAWSNWFATIGDKLVDGGNPFGLGRETTHTGTKELPHGKEAIAGYSILNAEIMNEAEKIAKDCPIITSVRVYEAESM